MSMTSIVLVLIGNLGVTLPQLVIIVTTLGSLIFMAVELRFGIMMLFFMYGVETVVFWAAGASSNDIILITSALLASFVMMALSILTVKSKQGGYSGGIV